MGQGELSMVSSKDAKEVGNREHHTHNRICVAFFCDLRPKETPWLKCLGKILLDSGVCTLDDSELIPSITQPVAMSSNCTKFIHILMTSNILETFDLSFTCFSHINREVDFIDFSMSRFHRSRFHRSNCHQIMHWEHQTNRFGLNISHFNQREKEMEA